MGIFDNFSGGKSRKDIRVAAKDASNILQTSSDKARTELNSGIDSQLAALKSGYTGATGNINQGYGQARTDLTTGYGNAENAITDQLNYSKELLNPYIQSGGKAQTAYDTALGLNGQTEQQGFVDNYAANDPFRQFNEDTATKALQRLYNASGSSSDGRFGLAASRANLERGSVDWNQYLNRLEGQSARGGQYATQLGQFANNAGSNIADLRSGLGTALANNSTARGGDLAQLAYQYGGDRGGIFAGRGAANADLTYGTGQQQAANRINRGNAIAGTRDTGMNNLLSLGQMAISGTTPNRYGQTAFGNLSKSFGF